MDPEIIMAKMGERMANIRKSHHVTQEKLGEIIGVSANQISRVENAGSNASLLGLVKFCDYFKCSLDYIVLGNENNPALSKLPEGVVAILNMEGSEVQEILLKYLEMFEIMRKKD